MIWKCGHPIIDTYRLGRGQARLRRIRRLESYKCSDCTEATLRARFATLQTPDLNNWINRRLADRQKAIYQICL